MDTRIQREKSHWFLFQEFEVSMRGIQQVIEFPLADNRRNGENRRTSLFYPNISNGL